MRVTSVMDTERTRWTQSGQESGFAVLARPPRRGAGDVLPVGRVCNPSVLGRTGYKPVLQWVHFFLPLALAAGPRKTAPSADAGDEQALLLRHLKELVQ